MMLLRYWMKLFICWGLIHLGILATCSTHLLCYQRYHSLSCPCFWHFTAYIPVYLENVSDTLKKTVALVTLSTSHFLVRWASVTTNHPVSREHPLYNLLIKNLRTTPDVSSLNHKKGSLNASYVWNNFIRFGLKTFLWMRGLGSR